MFSWRDIKNPIAGGAETFTHEVSRRWVNWGHEVTLFTAKFSDCKEEEFVDGVKIIRHGSKYTVFLKARKYYKKEFKGKFDVVIDQINTIPFFTPQFVKSGEKIFVLIHQLAREYWWYEVKFPLSVIGYFFELRWLCNNYANITTLADESTSHELLDLGFKKVIIHQEGINMKPLQTLPEKDKNPTIIYLGRLTKAKRPDHLIKAFQIVKKKIPNAQLWFVGDGYFKKKIEKKGNSLPIFFGKVSEEKKLDLLRKAWVLVNPSIREGFGLNVIEGNAMGTPAIAYNVPGLNTSIKNGKTGLLIENGNIQSLADGILTMINDSTLRKKLSENGLVWSKTFSWENAAREFINIIEDEVNREIK